MKLSATIIMLTAAAAGSLLPLNVSGDEVGDHAAALQDRVDSLRAEAAYAEALTLAKSLLAIEKSNQAAKSYEVADAERLIQTLVFISELPEKERQELAEADRLTEQYEIHYQQGDYAEATSLVKKQLEIRRRLLGSEHPEVAASLNNLAFLLHTQGDYKEAEKLYREALAMDRKLLGGEHPDIATDISNLAGPLRDLGDYAAAEELLREALQMYLDLVGEDNPEVASTLSNLAGVLMDQGDYEASEPLYRKALTLNRKLFGSEDLDVADSLNNLATLLMEKGDLLAAEPLLREALSIYRKLLGDEHPYIVISLNNLASLFHDLGNLTGAEQLYLEAVEMCRKVLEEGHPYAATTLNNLADLLHDKGDYRAADSLYREALEMRRKLFGKEHRDVAAILTNLARNFRDQGDYAEAEPLYREAVEMYRKLLGDEHPHVAMSLYSITSLLEARGDYASAEPLLFQAARAYESSRHRVGTALEQSTFQKSPYPKLANALLALARKAEAWQAAERDLGRTLADLLLTVGRCALTPTEAASEDSLKNVLSKLERELAAYREAAREDTTGEIIKQAEEARNRLLAAETVWSSFQRAIAKKYPLSEGRAFPLSRVQRAIPKRAAIIGWLDVEERRGEYASWGYAIKQTGGVVWSRLVPPPGYTSFNPHEHSRAFRDALASPASAAIGMRKDARELWVQRIAPLSRALEGVRELIVVPSGAMLGIPVEALVDDGGRYVGDLFSVSYCPSATIFAWLSEESMKNKGPRGEKLLLVGDPPFREAHLAMMKRDESTLETELAETEPLPDVSVLRSALAGNTEALAALPRLPGTRREVEWIASIFPEASTLLGPDASEQEMVRLAESGELGTFRTIHLATHALVDDERPERSALVLAQINLPDPIHAAIAGARIYDGLLTAKEIVREWSFDADLVTLSACETGLGKEAGGEGYIGFSHAFLQAGARSLLVSLWKVEDRATSLLMKRFYENYFGRYRDKRRGKRNKPMAKAEALQEAKQWLRTFTDEDGQKPFEHPYYWSAFILIGDRGIAR